MMGYGSDPGLIPRFCRELFDCIQTNDKVCVCVCVCVCVYICFLFIFAWVCVYICFLFIFAWACVCESVSCFHR